MKARVIAFAHYKGGTGKTTSCINVAGFLAKAGKKVLVVDLDPQASATSGLGVDKNTLRHTLYDVVWSACGHSPKVMLTDVLVETGIDNVHLAPSNLGLVDAENSMYVAENGALIIRNALSKARRFYDYILIDTPPSHGYFIINGLAAADSVALVLDSGVFSVEGLENLLSVLREVNSKLGLEVEVEMAILNKCRDQGILAKLLSPFFPAYRADLEAENEIRRSFKGPIFRVPFSDKVHESQLRGVPLSHYAPNSSAAQAFEKISKAIIQATPY